MKSLFIIGSTVGFSLLAYSFLRNTSSGFPVENMASVAFCVDSAEVSIVAVENIYRVKDTLDLKGKTWYLPYGSTIEVDDGIIKDGVVNGDNTKLVNKGVVFDNVRIKGSWNVPEISTSMFASLAYDNSLKDVFSLTSPEVHNTVYIARGVYKVIADYNFDRCLKINSYTEVTLDGYIILAPNAFP